MEPNSVKEFDDLLTNTLDLLAELYSLDTKAFLKTWSDSPYEFRWLVKRFSTGTTELSEYCAEVIGWQEQEYYKGQPEIKAFTLRNPEDLRQFEEFLDRMLRLRELSPTHFVDMLSQCPEAYWDKIDDLRETSYKLQRDSTEYLRCLEKCKEISFSYSEHAGNNFRDEYEEY